MNIPISIEECEAGGKELSYGGGWMAALIGRMLKDTEFRFTCASFGRTRKVVVSEDKPIVSIVIPEKDGLQACRDLVNNCNPDLIHIHGSEGAYGLLPARDLVQCPSSD